MTPLPPAADRFQSLDALRGLALLGILLMNIDTFVRPLQDASTLMVWSADAAGTAHWVLDVLVRGKFWMLFSLLFGMGFALVWARHAPDDVPRAQRWGRRRAVALMGLGLLHIVLLWNGDILLLYGLTALALVACMRWQPRTQLCAGLALYIGLWLLIGWLTTLLGQDGRALAETETEGRQQAARAAALYAEGSFLQVSMFRVSEFIDLVLPSMLLMQLPVTLAVFLLGVWLVRTGRVLAPHDHRTFWRMAALGGAALAAPLLGWSLQVRQDLDAASPLINWALADVLHALASLPMVCSYLGLWMLWSTSGTSGHLKRLLAPAGRMSLSLYLLQSLVCSLIFFGYGAGLYGQVDRWGQVQIALVLFIAQCVLASFWLRRFRQGPIEALVKAWVARA